MASFGFTAPASATGSFSLTNTPQPFIAGPARRFKPSAGAVQDVAQQNGTDGLGRRLRKSLSQVRRTIDYSATILNYVKARQWQKDSRHKPFFQPDLLYSSDVFPPFYDRDKPIDCVTTKFLRSAMNKVKCPIYTICWTPEGRRLLTGASSGEFTLWNGVAFNFETILQAHDVAVRAMVWSHNDQWMVTADHDGFIKYWQANMNNVKMFQAHKEPVRSLSFCPTDTKFCTASDDGTVRIWDFMRCHEERILRGHGSDVRSVGWHPQKALIVSGSRDSQQPVKLWDPKSGQSLATLHDHKNGVMDVKWNENGNWLISASRDHLIKLYDIRMMMEVQTFRGHKKEVTSLAWNPVHEGLFVSGGGDGAMMFWIVGNDKEVGVMENAHEQAIWTMAWHPLGHLLASGSNDNNTKFWTRNKPGDTIDDFYGMGSNLTGHFEQQLDVPTVGKPTGPRPEERTTVDEEGNTTLAIPGMGLEDDLLQKLKAPGSRYPHFDSRVARDFQAGDSKMQPRKMAPKKEQQQFERVWSVQKPLISQDSAIVNPSGDVDMRRQTEMEERSRFNGSRGLLPPPVPYQQGPGLFGGGGGGGYGFPGGQPPPGPPSLYSGGPPGPGFPMSAGPPGPPPGNYGMRFPMNQGYPGGPPPPQGPPPSVGDERVVPMDRMPPPDGHLDPRLQNAPRRPPGVQGDVDYRQTPPQQDIDLRGNQPPPISQPPWQQQPHTDDSRDPRARKPWNANGSEMYQHQPWNAVHSRHAQWDNDFQSEPSQGAGDDGSGASHVNPKRKWQQEYEATQHTGHNPKCYAGERPSEELEENYDHVYDNTPSEQNYDHIYGDDSPAPPRVSGSGPSYRGARGPPR